MSAARFGLSAWNGRPGPRAALFLVATLTVWRVLGAGGCRSSLPTWVGNFLALLQTSSEGAVAHFALPLPRSAARLAALLHTGHYFTYCCSSLMSHPKLYDWAKRSASSLCPSCAKSLPAVPASEAGPWDFPTTVFLRERLASGSPLQSFPHPTNPAASFALPRSSSPTTSSATSTTPSAFHRHLLPVGARATAEAHPPGEHPLPDLPS
jgi:hypothetical protein